MSRNKNTVIININKEILLKAIQSIRLKVEKQSENVNTLQLFVRVIDFAALSTPNTQIIYGRNGTGKTHLLKAFQQYCEAQFEQNKVLSIYIDFKDLELGPIMPSISLDDLILRFYRRFLHKIIDRLQQFSDEVITVPLLEKLIGGSSKDRKDEINKSIEKLNSMLNLEQVEELVQDYVRKVEKGRAGSSMIEGRIGLLGRTSLTKSQTGIKTGIGMSAEEVEKSREKIELIYGGLAVI